MQVSREGIDRIRRANPITAVLAERGIEVKRKGRSYLARCPFHADQNPSMGVTPSKGLFHCFGCQASGDVIGFIEKHDQVSFRDALGTLARRAGLSVEGLSDGAPVTTKRAPTPRRESKAEEEEPAAPPVPSSVLTSVVDHYHRTFCERRDAQEYLAQRGLKDVDMLRALRVGYADGSLLKAVPMTGELREQLVRLGVITSEGRELMGGCVVVPIPDPLTGQWTSLYGRGIRAARHCYLPGPLRGVLNFQAARTSDELVITESVIDALSFLQAGVGLAVPIYGTNGFTPDHLDLVKREHVARVILALDGDEAGRRASVALGEKLTGLGIAVRVANFPAGIKDANELLVSRNGDASAALREVLDQAEPRPTTSTDAAAVPAPKPAAGAEPQPEGLVLRRAGLAYRAETQSISAGRLKVKVKLTREGGEATRFHADAFDLYASRARSEFARRGARVVGGDPARIEDDLLALLVEVEATVAAQKVQAEAAAAPTMNEAERQEALAFLRRPDVLGQIVTDIDCLGYVGETINIQLLYLIAVSRKLPDPCSAVILSASGSGKSQATVVMEMLTPPEDVALFTRLTPQSLYYLEPGYLDRKLVVIEERNGSTEADYSIRVLQSRKKLIAAAPIKDPATGNLRTRTFVVEARASFIEATTASSVNHENATRCFELTMDESVEQTRRIHERQRMRRTEAGLALRAQAEAICRRHWNAQRLLEPLPVVIPFAERLTFPDAWMRTRRDHERFLNLIEVSAFLHQYQRERKGGAIVATVADYAVAYGLAAGVLAETLADLKKPLREAYERVRSLCEAGDGTVSRREIREALNQPDSTVRRWLTELVELEYVAVAGSERSSQGKSVRYRVAGQGPSGPGLVGLIPPDQLAQKQLGVSR